MVCAGEISSLVLIGRHCADNVSAQEISMCISKPDTFHTLLAECPFKLSAASKVLGDVFSVQPHS